jgi:amino acid transporter
MLELEGLRDFKKGFLVIIQEKPRQMLTAFLMGTLISVGVLTVLSVFAAWAISAYIWVLTPNPSFWIGTTGIGFFVFLFLVTVYSFVAYISVIGSKG